jgi:uncharacterized protein (DUF427 family)
MSLTFRHDPLGKHPDPANYRIDGPTHRLFFGAFPRRVRAVFAGATVLDTRAGRLLHETGLLAQLYVPRHDVHTELLEPSDHTTHCPFKGDAHYWSLVVGERRAPNAVWAYPRAIEAATWLRGYLAFSWNALDVWYDEDEAVSGHLRDPYTRVDVRQSSRHVRVTASGETVAETDKPKIVSETGLPNRYYIPPDDVRRELLQPSKKHTVCPYKGRASYHDIQVGKHRIPDAAWYYPEPLEDASKVRDHLCFLAEGVDVEVDGEPAG